MKQGCSLFNMALLALWRTLENVWHLVEKVLRPKLLRFIRLAFQFPVTMSEEVGGGICCSLMLCIFTVYMETIPENPTEN